MLSFIPCARAATAGEQVVVVLEFVASLMGAGAAAALTLERVDGEDVRVITPAGAWTAGEIHKRRKKRIVESMNCIMTTIDASN